MSALSPVHTSNNVEATFDFVASLGNNVERVFREISPFWTNEISRKNSFDIVAKAGNKVERLFEIVAKKGNNVEATFDFVETTFYFVGRIVRFVTCDNVAST